MTTNNGASIQDLQNHEIDQLDLRIIELLQQNGRIPYRDIARAIETPEATVRYRMKRLLDDGIITISAFINTGKVRHENVAYIELKVQSDFFESVLDELISMESISYLSAATGEFDIMLEYIYKDNQDLLSFIGWLKRKKEVIDLNSRNILKIYKAQYPARVSQE
ncbi:Lrp/AsnC family transcriptional regulator [Nodosilinea sp. E11]|uniref:Lrp/AsnC family transcriptional regulator n=1 Tax=Nodosilinea sp. E11 TaxID=3037479 RepID=UPI002934619B|nr:Lrp/AsnC family transcriptional regulator [Nodosilinea sp. E11]WOD39622.1 Lrp/AsnC family transcriptional regulator [Nodosilinea sp. E11]